MAGFSPGAMIPCTIRPWFAFQSARNDEPAGVGHGIFLLRLK